jgi:sugar phosphate isomerase/epimerase
MKRSTLQFTRRQVLAGGAAALAAAAQGPASGRTNFQLACMTLAYSGFPFARALEGIKSAGYDYVAWGTSHRANPQAERVDLIAADAPATRAKQLSGQCRDAGLDPLMMFSRVYVADEDSIPVHTKRIEQASAAGIPFLLTFGHIEKGGFPVWIRNLKELAPIARANGVMIVIKQHGGNTATGRNCKRIVQGVADDAVKICYDAGNVLDYENDDPIADIHACWQDVRAFAIKDHRNWPEDRDCGPGFGEIDHYRLLTPVANTGLDMPLAFENIFEPLVSRPSTPEGIDALARRAREYVETVIRGIQSA